MSPIINFISVHWFAVLISAMVIVVLLAVYAYFEIRAFRRNGPKDATGNGITVGNAKAFDNRSLALRIERLSASLANLKVVNQNVTENLANLQQQSSSEVTRSLTLDLKAVPAKAADKTDAPGKTTDKEGDKATKPGTTTQSATATVEAKPAVGLAAGDLLNDQLNLASQIMNLEMLYERSLTDRLIDGGARLQTVLGFQVSITPPTGYENCVAVVEVGVRLKQEEAAKSSAAAEDAAKASAVSAKEAAKVAAVAAEEAAKASAAATAEEEGKASAAAAEEAAKASAAAAGEAAKASAAAAGEAAKASAAATAEAKSSVSLVALIPQEKTYNAQSFSSSARSIGGSAVASVLTLGYTSKGESRQLFIHRDSDTIAFERHPNAGPKFFNEGPFPTVFGWEFRPVLDRPTVAAGTRQMLAVIAVSAPEKSESEQVTLEIKTRSYWRRYNRKKQTSSIRWSLFPWKVDASNVQESVVSLDVPNTAKIQDDLKPTVTKIKWVNSGPDRATVIVMGANFFSGTRVVIGGVVLREEDGSLILKSNQALEFETAIGALSNGDAVLSGRFGSSFHLKVPEEERPVTGLFMERAQIKPFRYTKSFRITIDITGKDKNNDDVDLTLLDLQKLPEAILFVGNEPVPMPYDYSNVDPGRQAGTGNPGDPPTTDKKFVRVAAWIPAKTLTKSPSLAFRVPFCGIDYQASLPVVFSEPTVTRMGTNGDYSVFRIAQSPLLGSPLRVELDRVYEEEPWIPNPIGTPDPQPMPKLVRISKLDCRFLVPTEIVSKYQNLVVRTTGDAEPYLLPIPVEEKPKPRIDKSIKPPEIIKSSLGPIEWSGTGLDAISSATLYKSTTLEVALPPGASPQAGTPADCVTYNNGEKIVVSFCKGSTEFLGKAEVEFQTPAGDSIRVPFFITKEGSITTV
jgi:hypothetical protein